MSTRRISSWSVVWVVAGLAGFAGCGPPPPPRVASVQGLAGLFIATRREGEGREPPLDEQLATFNSAAFDAGIEVTERRRPGGKITAHDPELWVTLKPVVESSQSLCAAVSTHDFGSDFWKGCATIEGASPEAHRSLLRQFLASDAIRQYAAGRDARLQRMSEAFAAQQARERAEEAAIAERHRREREAEREREAAEKLRVEKAAEEKRQQEEAEKQRKLAISERWVASIAEQFDRDPKTHRVRWFGVTTATTTAELQRRCPGHKKPNTVTGPEFATFHGGGADTCDLLRPDWSEEEPWVATWRGRVDEIGRRFRIAIEALAMREFDIDRTFQEHVAARLGDCTRNGTQETVCPDSGPGREQVRLRTFERTDSGLLYVGLELAGDRLKAKERAHDAALARERTAEQAAKKRAAAESARREAGYRKEACQCRRWHVGQTLTTGPFGACVSNVVQVDPSRCSFVMRVVSCAGKNVDYGISAHDCQTKEEVR